MNIDNRIWVLIARNLAQEASMAELQELDEMLKQYPDTDWIAKAITEWWRQDIREDLDQRGALLFERIKKTIKAKEEEGNGIKKQNPGK